MTVGRKASFLPVINRYLQFDWAILDFVNMISLSTLCQRSHLLQKAAMGSTVVTSTSSSSAASAPVMWTQVHLCIMMQCLIVWISCGKAAITVVAIEHLKKKIFGVRL